MDIERIRELVELLQGTDIRRLEVKWEGGQIELERQLEGAVQATAGAPQPTAGDPYGPGHAALEAGDRLGIPVVGFCHSDPAALAALHLGSWAEPPVRRGEVTTCPFVGTFYRSAGPASKPFTEIGARVRKGDTLCIVEAMKLMNEIESEWAGVVREILVPNEAAVQFGQELFVIEAD